MSRRSRSAREVADVTVETVSLLCTRSQGDDATPPPKPPPTGQRPGRPNVLQPSDRMSNSRTAQDLGCAKLMLKQPLLRADLNGVDTGTSATEMPRRSPYTRVEKIGQRRPDHVRGLGDVVFKGFQCLNADCQSYLIVREQAIGRDFRIECPTCRYTHSSGGTTKYFDYRLTRRDGELIEEGEFLVSHDEYVREAQRLKYCLLCYALKPLNLYDAHRARSSGRQGECRLCKRKYNGIKNQSRIRDQHREAAQRRRLYGRLGGGSLNIDSRQVFDRFDGRCFNCARTLTHDDSGRGDYNIDHTLPASLLWPVTTETGTLLCPRCNNEKHDRWPSEYYAEEKLRRLARLTDYTYHLLAGDPTLNTAAVNDILADPDGFIEEWIPYPADIRRIRKLVLDYTGKDIFVNATRIPDHLR